MATLGDLVIKLSLDAAGFISDTGKASYAAEKFGDAMKKRLDQAKGAAGEFSNAMNRALGGIGGELTEGVRRTGETIKEITETFEQLSKKVGPVGGTLGALAVAATAVAAGVTAIAVAVARNVEEMNNMAQAAQIDADAFQAIAIAANESGVSTEKLVGAMAHFNQQISEAAKGANQAALNFAALGVAVTEGGKLRETEAVLRDVAKAIAELPRGAQRAAYELAFFAKTGTQLDAFLSEFEEKTKRAAESAAIFGPELRAMTSEFNTALADAKLAIEGFANAIARLALPSITALLKIFADWLKLLSTSEDKTKQTGAAFTAFAQNIKAVALMFAVLVDWGTIIVDTFTTITDAIGLQIFAYTKLSEVQDRLMHLDLSGAKKAFLEFADVAADTAKKIADRWSKPTLTESIYKNFDATLAQVQTAIDKRVGDEKKKPKGGAAALPDIDRIVGAARQTYEATTKAAEAANREESRLLQLRNQRINDANANALISFDDFYQKRRDAQLEFTRQTILNIQKEIAAAQKLLTDASFKGPKGTISLLKPEEQAAIQARITDLKRQQGEASLAGASAQERIDAEAMLAQKAYARSVQETNLALVEMREDTVRAADIKFDLQTADLLAHAYEDGNQGLIDMIEHLRAATHQQADFNKELQIAEDTTRNLARTEAVIASQVRSGHLTDFEGQAKINDARRRTIALNQQEIEKLREMKDLTPSQIQRINDLIAANEILANSIDEVGKAINDAFIGAASDALVEFIEHTKSAQEAFNDFAKSVVHAINQMIAQELAKKLFRSMFGEDTSSGAAGIGGFLSKLFGASTAGGGAAAGSTLAESTTQTVVYAGAMAGGGTFNANDLVLVGEKGPELIRPSFSGQVYPSGTAPGGNVNVNMNITTPDAASFQRSQGQIVTAMALAGQRALARR